MRTKSAQVDAIIANPSHGARVLVTLFESGGAALVTLGDAAGAPWDGPDGLADPVHEVEIEHSVDSYRTARVRLQRQQGLYSFAPLAIGGNPLYIIAGEPNVDIARRILVECELTLPDIGSVAATRITIFDGYIDEVAWPDDVMELVCTDKFARLRDTWIEAERAYGLAQGVNATKGCLVWRHDLPALALNELVVPSEKRQNGHFYKVTAVSGAQLVTEPTWPTGGGSTVVSGGVTFTEAGATSPTTGVAIETLIQQVLNDNGLGSLVTLQTPVSPGWNVKPYLQQRESVAEALQAMVDQLGWWLRFEWSSSLNRYELHLVQPDRTSSTVHKTVLVDDEVECTELGVAVWEIRNVVRVIYGDSSSLDPSGNPVRITREVSDSASIAKYGRRFMEVVEDDASNIDTASEADRMANAILADLKDPQIALSNSFPVDPYLELGDRITVQNDNLRFTTSQTLAVQSLKHTFRGESARTSVALRGAPAARFNGWLAIDASSRQGNTHQQTLLNASGSAGTNTATVGGQRFTSSDTRLKNAWGQAEELHISATPGFTPSSSTLASSSETNAHEVANLVPGKTYYAKRVGITKNADRIVRGEPSEEFSFTAGRAKTGHYDSRSTQSHLPLNGNFEHASDDLAAAPFDHWAVVTRPAEATEVWGSSGSVFHGNDASKGNYVELRAHASKRGNIVSSAFEVRRGVRALNIYLSIMRTGSSASSGKDLIVDVNLYADSALTTLVRSDSIFLSGSASGDFPSLNTWYDKPIDYGFGYGALATNANFMTIGLRRGTTGDSSFAWRIGDVYAQEADFFRARIECEGPFTVASTVGFGSGWSDYGGVTATAAYFKDAFGIVHLRGNVQRTSGTGLLIFTLPAGYRPTDYEFFTVQATSAYGDVEIRPDGQVRLGTGTPTYISLSGITFRAA